MIDERLIKAYQALIFWGGTLKSPILLLCRLYWGTLFVFAGWEKLSDIASFAQFLSQYHFPFPTLMAYAATLAEFLGGMCLVMGFASRLMAIPLIITMIMAYLTVHAKSLSLLWHNPHVVVGEAPFNFLLAALLILAFGPGRFSMDFMLEKWFFARGESFPKHQHPK